MKKKTGTKIYFNYVQIPEECVQALKASSWPTLLGGRPMSMRGYIEKAIIGEMRRDGLLPSQNKKDKFEEYSKPNRSDDYIFPNVNQAGYRW